MQFVYEKIHRNSVIKQLINLLTTCSSLHFLLDRKIGNIWKLSKSKIASAFSLNNYTDKCKSIMFTDAESPSVRNFIANYKGEECFVCLIKK